MHINLFPQIRGSGDQMKMHVEDIFDFPTLADSDFTQRLWQPNIY